MTKLGATSDWLNEMPKRKKRIAQGESIEWSDYPRVKPGEYVAYCAWVGRYWDSHFKRWTCLLRFDLLEKDGTTVIAQVPMWLSLGNGDSPRASRRRQILQ